VLHMRLHQHASCVAQILLHLCYTCVSTNTHPPTPPPTNLQPNKHRHCACASPPPGGILDANAGYPYMAQRDWGTPSQRYRERGRRARRCIGGKRPGSSSLSPPTPHHPRPSTAARSLHGALRCLCVCMPVGAWLRACWCRG